VIVVEDEDRVVIGIALAADAQVSRAEVAAVDVLRRWSRRHRSAFTLPRPILSVRRNDHPFLPEWVPSLLPRRGARDHDDSFTANAGDLQALSWAERMKE
jgi:hypothetical protein